MQLMAHWEQRLTQVPNAAPDTRLSRLPQSPHYYREALRYLTQPEEVQALLGFVQQRPLSHVGIDSEFGFDRPPVLLARQREKLDIRSIRPLLLSLALVEPVSATESHLYPVVIDVRDHAVQEPLRALLGLPLCFVGHHLKSEWFCLWRLGLLEPDRLWDTFIAEKALHLGRQHPRYRQPVQADALEQARANEDAAAEQGFRLSLVATCHRYGVPHAFASEKRSLQQSFLQHAPHEPFSEQQRAYAAEDAIAAARLYEPQVLQSTRHGLLQHLVTVEMPWVRTNARMEWEGFCVDTEQRPTLTHRLREAEAALHERLQAQGLNNVRSPKQLQRFFEDAGLAHTFLTHGRFSFDREQLKKHQDAHPVIPLIRALRRVQDLANDPLMLPELVGVDGRVHPEYQHLGTHTGRQTSRWPNVLGLDGLLRPLVIPSAGHGIAEVDFSQVEVGIAAAVYQDPVLIEMFNTGDVYSQMAKEFYQADLSAELLALPDRVFKERCAELRKRMKVCTLGMIYGISPHGIAGQLGATVHAATGLQQRFRALFPRLTQALADAEGYGGQRGYAQTMTGLRRHRAAAGAPSPWERRWLTNHPVQGSAAVVFKAAGNRLDRLLRPHGARLLIALHDSFIFEAPLPALTTVSELVCRVMCEAIQGYFPALKPLVEVNLRSPNAWTKDGDPTAIHRWIDDTLTRFEQG